MSVPVVGFVGENAILGENGIYGPVVPGPRAGGDAVPHVRLVRDVWNRTFAAQHAALVGVAVYLAERARMSAPPER
jgi:hypothetical protein